MQTCVNQHRTTGEELSISNVLSAFLCAANDLNVKHPVSGVRPQPEAATLLHHLAGVMSLGLRVCSASCSVPCPTETEVQVEAQRNEELQLPCSNGAIRSLWWDQTRHHFPEPDRWPGTVTTLQQLSVS
ncbi:PTS galactitol transporter subunit IIC [Anopheles sinensis]|uniref:PTS galactitol transporter subunit IIC n=1 Tax=Anopheles sinensis TaxID=74873 RepID=A0A084VUE8_ANOSI|nr:PTS galactitol transporter subunit IIC [Anopheles sinensis]